VARTKIGRLSLWVFGVVAGLGAALALSLGAVLVFARTPWGNAWIRGELTRRLNAHIAGTVAVGALELDPRRLILDDVTLAEPSGALVMRVKRIVVDIAPLGLLRREVHLVRLHAADPRLWLWREAGALDVQRALASRAGGARRKPSRAGTRWAFRLDAFSSTSGTVTYESAPPGEERTTTIALDDVTATGGGAWRPRDQHFGARLELSARCEGAVTGPLHVAAHVERSGPDRLAGGATVSLADLLRAQVTVSAPGPTLVVQLDRAVMPPRAAAAVLPDAPLATDVSVAGTVTLAPRRIAANLRGALGGGTLRVQGDLDPVALATASGLRVIARDVDLGTLLRAARGRALVSADLAVSAGSLRPRAISASITAHAGATVVQGRTFGPLALEVKVRDGEIETAGLAARWPGARLRLHAEGRTDAARVVLALHASSLGRATAPLMDGGGDDREPIGGRGRIVAHATGSLLDMAGTASTRLSAWFPRLTIGGTTVRRARLAVRAAGPDPSGRRSFELSAGARLGERGGPMRLRAAGTLHLARRRAILEEFALAYPGTRWVATREAHVTFAADRRSISGLRLRSGEQVIAAEGSVARSQLAGSVALSGVRLSALPGARRLPIGGRVSGDVKLSGTAEAPTVNADLGLRHGRLGAARGLSASIAGRYEDERVDARVHAESDWGAFNASMHVPATWPPRGDAPVRIDGALTRVDLTKLGAALAPERPVAGQLTADLRVTGSWGSPVLHAKVSARRLAVGARRFARGRASAIGELSATARYADRRLRFAVNADDLHGGNASLKGELSVDLSLPAALSLDPARTEIDARATVRGLRTAWAAGLSDRLRTVAGRLDVDARVVGTIGRPRLIGRVSWRRGRLIVAPAKAAEAPAAGARSR
jgi:hypothetical protein